jgi:hypothetical protein
MVLQWPLATQYSKIKKVTNFLKIVCQLSLKHPSSSLDKDGVVRRRTFRRAESKYSIEQVGVSITFCGELDGVSFNNPATVKYASHN